jgi:hypothetical protein
MEKAMNSYEKFVMDYTRRLKTPRTASEAFRDAEYANPITFYESPFMSDFKRGVEQLVFISIWVALLGFLLYIVLSL